MQGSRKCSKCFSFSSLYWSQQHPIFLPPSSRTFPFLTNGAEGGFSLCFFFLVFSPTHKNIIGQTSPHICWRGVTMQRNGGWRKETETEKGKPPRRQQKLLLVIETSGRRMERDGMEQWESCRGSMVCGWYRFLWSSRNDKKKFCFFGWYRVFFIDGAFWGMGWITFVIRCVSSCF